MEEWGQAPLGMLTAWNIGSVPWILSLSNHSTVERHSVFFSVLNEIRRVVPTAKGTIFGGHYPAARWNLGRVGIKGGCILAGFIELRSWPHAQVYRDSVPALPPRRKRIPKGNGTMPPPPARAR